MSKKRPKHHHYISRFYLRRFADDDQIAMYRRATGHRRAIGTKNAAVESDFYTVISEDGTPSAVVEKALGVFEGYAGAILRQIDDGTFPPPEEQRHRFAAYIALMLTRTPEYRYTNEALANLEPIFIEAALPESVRAGMRQRNDREADEDETDIATTLRAYLAATGEKTSKTIELVQALSFALDRLAPLISAMHWQLVTTEDFAFVTSDHPVTYWRDPSSAVKMPSAGLETADEIYFPVSPRQLIVLTQADVGRAPFQATDESIARVNTGLITAAYEVIFSHPHHHALVGTEIPSERPLLHVNGAPIFRDGRGSNEARRRVESSMLRSGTRRARFAIVSAGHNHIDLGPGAHGNPVVSEKFDRHVALLNSWPDRQSNDSIPFRVIDGDDTVLFHFMRGNRYWSVIYTRSIETWEDHGEQPASQM